MPQSTQTDAPLASVVIATYDRAQLVVEAVQSVRRQTYAPIEIVVVDDGSTDDTAERLAQFGDEIVYIHQDNAGVSAARNRGLKAATGHYVALLDSDDQWHPEKLAKQVAFMQAHPDFGMVLANTRVTSIDGEVHHNRPREYIPRDGYTLDTVLRAPQLVPSAVLLHRRVLDDVGYFDTSLKTAEDIDYMLRVALAHKIGVIDEDLTFCSQEHGGLSDLHQTYHDHIYVTERFVNRYGARLGAKNRRDVLFFSYSEGSLGVLWKRDFRGALALGLKTLPHIDSVPRGAWFLKEFAVCFTKTVLHDAKQRLWPLKPR